MSGHNHTRFRNDDGPWSVCPSTCPESTSVMGELHRLREVVARVEGLATMHGWHLANVDPDRLNAGFLWRSSLAHQKALCAALWAKRSTDSDPALTERYSGSQGAGDGV